MGIASVGFKSVASTVLPLATRRGQLARRVTRRASYDPVWVVLDRFGRTHPDVVFVQIGSHNGYDSDPLARFVDRHEAWRGVMVEPMPEHFEALTQRRGDDPRLRLVQAAITDHEGTVEMVTVETTPGDAPMGGSALQPPRGRDPEARSRDSRSAVAPDHVSRFPR